MAKFEIEFDGLQELIQQLNDLGADVIPIAEKALEATHAYITPLVHQKMQKPNLPAQGKYSVGYAENQIIDDVNIEWDGYSGSVDIGFSLKEGLTPIYLMRGTKYMKPANGLYAAIYGKKTKNEVARIQEEIFAQELEKVMNGGK